MEPTLKTLAEIMATLKEQTDKVDELIDKFDYHQASKLSSVAPHIDAARGKIALVIAIEETAKEPTR